MLQNERGGLQPPQVIYPGHATQGTEILHPDYTYAVKFIQWGIEGERLNLTPPSRLHQKLMQGPDVIGDLSSPSTGRALRELLVAARTCKAATKSNALLAHYQASRVAPIRYDAGKAGVASFSIPASGDPESKLTLSGFEAAKRCPGN